MKSSFSSYMVFVQDLENAKEPMSKLDENLKYFLDEHVHCFYETIPIKLPPPRRFDDHRINLIHSTPSPNRTPY